MLVSKFVITTVFILECTSLVKQTSSIIVIHKLNIHYSECEHMTKLGSLKFMPLVATSDPILAVL